MIEFFLFEEKNVLFWRYSDFCDFCESLNFRICDVIIDITAH